MIALAFYQEVGFSFLMLLTLGAYAAAIMRAG
jgi:hypothetical protein